MNTRFITFEGGEGAGKSTQIQLTADFLRKQGLEVVVTREPGGTQGAENVRDMLVRDTGYTFTPKAELALMYGARVDHTEKIIQPALENGSWVLCDRYADSSRVYQGIAQSVGLKTVQALHDALLEGFEPDITFFIDVPVNTGLSRTKIRDSNEDRFENMDTSFHEKIRNGFLKIADKNARFSIIDGTQDIDNVFSQIKSVLKAYV